MSRASPWSALKQVAARMPKVVREHEILRVVAIVHGKDKSKSAEAVRREVLVWAQNRSGGRLPEEAFAFDEFEYFSGGRNSVAVRIKSRDVDIWAIRADDPDKSVPGRVWTTEVVVALGIDKPCNFSARLLVSTSEDELEIEPHVPGFVQQVADRCVLSCGSIDLSPDPCVVESEDDIGQLIEILIDQRRKLPVFVLTVPDISESYRRILVTGGSGGSGLSLRSDDLDSVVELYTADDLRQLVVAAQTMPTLLRGLRELEDHSECGLVREATP